MATPHSTPPDDNHPSPRPKPIAIPIREAPPPAPASMGDSLISFIQQASRDQSVDLVRVEKLIEMYERMKDRENEQAFDEAMSLAQSEMRPVALDASNPQTRSRYASYHALDKAIRPIYTRHGFVVTFNTAEGAPELHVRVVCSVSKGGYTRRYQVDMPADGKGAKGGDVMTRTHATGSALTYGRRYLLAMAFNIAVGNAAGDTDDDGNAAGMTTADHISKEQAGALRALLKERRVPLAPFLTWAKVGRIEEIPASHYASCNVAINAYKGKPAGGRNERRDF